MERIRNRDHLARSQKVSSHYWEERSAAVASPFVRGFPSFEIEIEIELPFVQQRSFISLHEHESNRPSLTVDVEAEARLGVHPIEPTQLATVARG